MSPPNRVLAGGGQAASHHVQHGESPGAWAGVRADDSC